MLKQTLVTLGASLMLMGGVAMADETADVNAGVPEAAVEQELSADVHERPHWRFITCVDNERECRREARRHRYANFRITHDHRRCRGHEHWACWGGHH